MRRREFITLLGGVALAWPLAARAEQADRMRRVGVLMGYAETDPQAKALLAEFTQAVSEFGWIEGRNLRIEVRWAPANADLMRTFAKELVSLQPDVILTNSTPVTAALKRETSTIPPLYLRSLPTRLARVSSRACRARGETLLGSARWTKGRWRASGLSCSLGSRPT
jgi:ABC-type uncharacterized transport system substrate-binding protein